jgi:hypothetical protein
MAKIVLYDSKPSVFWKVDAVLPVDKFIQTTEN